MLQATHIEKETEEQNVKFYTDNYPEVELVTCSKCKTKLCLWFLDPAMAQRFEQNHHRGMQRVVLSAKLRSTRKRLDGHMGYECRCGNNSILAKVEEGIVPQLHFDAAGRLLNPNQSLDIGPHHQAAVQLVMARDGDLAKIKELKHEVVVDGFVHRRLK